MGAKRRQRTPHPASIETLKRYATHTGETWPEVKAATLRREAAWRKQADLRGIDWREVPTAFEPLR